VGMTRYCIGLSTAAKKLQATVGWTVKDKRIESKLGISWYTFYRWQKRGDPQLINSDRLQTFLVYYNEQMGTYARVKVFEERDVAVRYLKAKRKIARSK